MSYAQKIGKFLAITLGSGLLALSAQADDCGAPPNEPAIPDGAEATMEELVAASKAVKQYIADADTFLDCRDALAKTPEYQDMADGDKKELIEEGQALLIVRNGIADRFNAEVAAYKEANPE